MTGVRGTRLGPYEVGALVGEGGMGRVYRATDTNLKRTVAIKILPDAVAHDAGRMARFQREAEVLARLNHPNIAQIYGLEKADGSTAIVMEFVEGPTLADLIAGRGAAGAAAGLPADEALGIATQIASALEAAHEQGVVHRDLKPANVKVQTDGTVKVLDFGLAKAVEPPAAAPPDASRSPTVTSPAQTEAGVVLGTAAYMSPEQAKGRAVDARADVWAFGVVLFEMLSGRRPFGGADVADVLGAVLRLEPEWNGLPPDVPTRLRRVLQSCLQKNPRQRLANMQDVRLAIEGAFDTAEDAGVSSAPSTRSSVWRNALLASAAAIAGSIVTGYALWPTARDQVPAVRFTEELPAGLRFRSTGDSLIAISPDGRKLVYNTTEGLYLRSMDESAGRLLPGTEETLSGPFFSPDGRSVGYLQAGQLKRLALSGGAPVAIAPASSPTGVTWTADDTIMFAQRRGIMRVTANGGEPTLVATAAPDEVMDGPQLLPDGDSLLFSVRRSAAFSVVNLWDAASIVVQSLRSGERKELVKGGSAARYIQTGHLVYALDQGLHAVRFDARTLEVRGGPVSILVGVSRGSIGATANYDVSADGTLVYAVGTGVFGPSRLAWVDREGKIESIPTISPRRFAPPRLSPDGQRAGTVADGDVRVYDLASGRESRLTSDAASVGFVAWRDDETVAYTSARGEQDTSTNVWVQRIDGVGSATRVTTLTGQVDVDAWAPDGRTLAVHHHRTDGTTGLLMIPFADGRASEPRPFSTGSTLARNTVFSPDGKYVAYLSNETGRFEAYIQPFPGPGPKTPVSAGGAGDIVWARNGELFYRRTKDAAIVAVPVTTSAALKVGSPKVLFRMAGVLYGISATRFAVPADGQRLLMSAAELDLGRGGSGPRQAVHVVLNWVDELQRLVPAR